MSDCQIVGHDLLLEFLEVAFHGILYYRKIYPLEIFERKKIYGVGTWMSQHPEVNEYIDNVLATIKQAILVSQDSIKCINLIFLDNNDDLIEKFVFDILNLREETRVLDPYFRNTEEALRTICLKLSMTESYLKPLPEESSFKIEIETNETVHDHLNKNPELENFPWIIKESSTKKKIDNNFLLPLHSVKTEYLGLQVFAISHQK